VNLHALARRSVDALAHSGRSGEHDVVLEGGAVHAEGDAARLEQVIANLLDNAVKYTPSGGRIVIRTALIGDEATVSVRDTGRGIEPALLPRVFDPFVQEPQGLDRARGGLGLGLAVVKRLVELHGGSVAVDSPGAGGGAEFVVRLPATSPPAVAPGDRTPGSSLAAAARRRVLVVEDNADAREMLQLALESTGHLVEVAADGPSGLARLASFRPDVALIDVGLPGLDGYAVARIARSQPDTCAIRLVALTGYSQADDRARALSAGFDRHVTKPVDPLTLEQVVRGL
jgi:CheY-like chemotaxis protein